jgi:hypothetical protein
VQEDKQEIQLDASMEDQENTQEVPPAPSTKQASSKKKPEESKATPTETPDKKKRNEKAASKSARSPLMLKLKRRTRNLSRLPLQLP